jgi:serine phosphatase RsbU (regulator of sigma subunit)
VRHFGVSIHSKPPERSRLRLVRKASSERTPNDRDIGRNGLRLVISRSMPVEHDPGRDDRSSKAAGLERPKAPRPAPWLLASAVLLAAAFASDVATGSEVASSLFYVVAILFGAWFVSDRVGLVLAVLSVIGWWLAYEIAAKPFTHTSTLYWNLLAELTIYLIVAVAVAQTRLALERLRSTARQLAIARDALDKETRAVGDLQREMLPRETPSVPGYSWETAYVTSTRAGGDYYDFLRGPDGRIGIVVADASGHGAPAAVLMAMLRMLLHAERVSCGAPEKLLERLNGQLTGALAPGRFVTACVAWLEPVSGRLDFSLAGHPPPWIVRGGTHRAGQLTASGGPPLGLFEDARYERGEAWLLPGDTLVFHTDGLTEAMGPTRELYGESRLAESLASADGADLFSMRTALLASVDRHRAGAALSDDLTLLLVRREDGDGR